MGPAFTNAGPCFNVEGLTLDRLMPLRRNFLAIRSDFRLILFDVRGTDPYSTRCGKKTEDAVSYLSLKLYATDDPKLESYMLLPERLKRSKAAWGRGTGFIRIFRP